MSKLIKKPPARETDDLSHESEPKHTEPVRPQVASQTLIVQGTLGNQAIRRILLKQGREKDASPTSGNPKLHAPGDAYEQEADRVADQVMNMGQPHQSNQPDAAADSAIDNSKGGNALDPETRQFFEPRFGQSFANVRVHSDH